MYYKYVTIVFYDKNTTREMPIRFDAISQTKNWLMVTPMVRYSQFSPENAKQPIFQQYSSCKLNQIQSMGHRVIAISSNRGEFNRIEIQKELVEHGFFSW